MKQYWFIIPFALIATSSALSQTSSSIVSDLNTNKAGQGSVKIYEDQAISGLIGSKQNIISESVEYISNDISNSNIESTSRTTLFKETTGYKIQIFSGNDQKASRKEAYSRKDMILNDFPDMEVSVTYNSPVWRVRAGNFATYEEAFQALGEIKNAYPRFGKEMQIVKAKVKLPMN